MREAFTFRPPRNLGLIFHGLAILVLLFAGVFGLWQASHARIGVSFLLYLLPGIVATVVSPFLFYRALGLQRASYAVGRDGIRLRWGLRSEDIPMNAIIWVGPAEDFRPTIPRPPLSWPGAVLGVRKLPDGRLVEFLAARARGLALIVTKQRIFAISPADRDEFLRAFRLVAEFGSLSPLVPSSIYPDILFTRAWSDQLARGLMLSGFGVSLALLVWVALAVPLHPQIALRLTPQLTPAEEAVPGVRLMLLPVLDGLFFVVNLLLGFFFYRHKETQVLSYLMWASSTLVALIFLGAVYFLLRAT